MFIDNIRIIFSLLDSRAFAQKGDEKMIYDRRKFGCMIVEITEIYYRYQEIPITTKVATINHATKMIFFNPRFQNTKAYEETRRYIEQTAEFKDYKIIG